MVDQGLWILMIAAIIFVAELIAGRHRGVYAKNDYIVTGLCLAGAALVRPILAIVVAGGVAFALPGFKGSLREVPFWPALIVTMLTIEFCNYWVHRKAHEWKDSRFLDWHWRMHRTHHTAKFMNISVNFRIAPLWSFVSAVPWVSGVVYYLGQEVAAGTALIAFQIWGYVTHSDFRWDDVLRRHPATRASFRVFEHIMITPGVHHSHHGYGKDGGNFRNFGVFFSIFDWAFGTLHIPQGRPFRYGVPGATPSWAGDVFAPFRKY